MTIVIVTKTWTMTKTSSMCYYYDVVNLNNVIYIIDSLYACFKSIYGVHLWFKR